MTYQLVGAVGFVVHAESVDDGGAGFVKTQHVHFGAFRRSLITTLSSAATAVMSQKCARRKSIVTLAIASLKSNALMNWSAELKNTAGNGIRTVIRRFIQFRPHREVVANLVGENNAASNTPTRTP